MIFRKVALERLSSPEQLDQMVKVTDPRGWIALAGLGAVLLAAIVWGIWGSIPTEAQGDGILLRQGGVSDLVSNATGQVQDVLVSIGDVIEKGQPVARIQQDALLRQIADDRSKLAAVRSRYGEAVRTSEQQKRLQARDMAQQRANLERTIGALEKDLAILRDRLDAQQNLLNDGLITKETFLGTQQSLNAKRDQLAQARLDLNGLDLKGLESVQQIDQQLETRQTAIRDLELEIKELNAKLGENVNILSPYSGRVLEVLANRGDVVNPGTAILSVEVLSEDLQAVLFVPASAGKKVQLGMTVRVAPSTVKREEYGAMLGKVSWVAEFPSTSRGMKRLLGNDALVTKLMEQGPPIQVNVTLARDPSTPTGYRWSSSRGPNLKISSGTLASGDVVVKEDRPLRLVIPTLREKLGL
ncbi:MAG TPA: NHLP bacteriocin system secretion protein [Thermoanaerobaculia bacterium]